MASTPPTAATAIIVTIPAAPARWRPDFAATKAPIVTTPAPAVGAIDAVVSGFESWRRVLVTAIRAGVPTPTFSSSLAYLDALRRHRLPAALIQGLRDNFGAHTYRRVDKDGTFHTLWAAGKNEIDG